MLEPLHTKKPFGGLMDHIHRTLVEYLKSLKESSHYLINDTLIGLWSIMLNILLLFDLSKVVSGTNPLFSCVHQPASQSISL